MSGLKLTAGITGCVASVASIGDRRDCVVVTTDREMGIKEKNAIQAAIESLGANVVVLDNCIAGVVGDKNSFVMAGERPPYRVLSNGKPINLCTQWHDENSGIVCHYGCESWRDIDEFGTTYIDRFENVTSEPRE